MVQDERSGLDASGPDRISCGVVAAPDWFYDFVADTNVSDVSVSKVPRIAGHATQSTYVLECLSSLGQRLRVLFYVADDEGTKALFIKASGAVLRALGRTDDLVVRAYR